MMIMMMVILSHRSHASYSDKTEVVTISMVLL